MFNPWKSSALQSAASRLYLETFRPALAAGLKAEAEAERRRAEELAADFPETNPSAVNPWKPETFNVTSQMEMLTTDPLNAFACVVQARKAWCPPLNTFPGWLPKI